jgi:cellulose biosynthesis protein BcsQ
MRAHLRHLHAGGVAVTLELPGGTTHELSAFDPTEARGELLAAARRFLREEGHGFGRLAVVDGEDEWELALPADRSQEPVILTETPRLNNGHAPRDSPPPSPTPPPSPAVDHSHVLDRRALYAPRRGVVGRLGDRLEHLLKDQAERREDHIDAQLNRRWVVHDTNIIVIASSKGGVAKTTNTIQLGTCLATYLPNQRVAAIDFNVGGGALGAAAAEDRQAAHTMFELHRDRSRITRHSLLQPYVSSLPSGLDLLTVPPQPELALEITSQHYQELFDELLIDSYDLLLLDTSPDIMNPVTRWALASGTQLVISTEQGFMTGSVVQHALDYLLSHPAAGAGEKTIAVINKVLNDARAGSAEETERALRSANATMPVIRIPYDLDLRALIDSGHYDLSLVKRRSTRLPIKEMALEVCRRLV